MRLSVTIGAGPANDTELANHVRYFPEARILVVGDSSLDRYVTETPQRLSPEAPVLRPERHRRDLGGVTNAAVNVATLGGTAGCSAWSLTTRPGVSALVNIANGISLGHNLVN